MDGTRLKPLFQMHLQDPKPKTALDCAPSIIDILGAPLCMTTTVASALLLHRTQTVASDKNLASLPFQQERTAAKLTLLESRTMLTTHQGNPLAANASQAAKGVS